MSTAKPDEMFSAFSALKKEFDLMRKRIVELEAHVSRLEKENKYNNTHNMNSSVNEFDRVSLTDTIKFIEHEIEQGMNPNQINHGFVSNLINWFGHVNNSEQICKFLIRIKTKYNIELRPIDSNLSYVQQALSRGLPDIAKCLYDLGCQFDNTIPVSYPTRKADFLSIMIESRYRILKQEDYERYDQCLALTQLWLTRAK